jgi:predicted outer membrane repeat protein
MKHLLTFLLISFSIILFGSLLIAETTIPGGDVSGVWHAEDAPYFIEGNITIPTTEQLTIEPGVDVIFQGHYKATVNGRLTAEGTQNDSIRFYPADETEGWWGVRFKYTQTNEQDSSRVVYCSFSGAKAIGYELHSWDRRGGAVGCFFSSDVLIDNCLFYNNEADYGGAVAISDSDIIMRNCVVRDNYAEHDAGGIVIRNNSQPNIYNVQVTDNRASYDGGGIFCCANSAPTITNVEISRNSSLDWESAQGGGVSIWGANPLLTDVIINDNSCFNSGGGGYITSDSDVVFNNVTISRNSCNSRGGGLYISNSSLQLSNVTISENYVDATNSDWAGGGGLYIHSNADVTFDPENRCNIYSNYSLTNTRNDIMTHEDINCNVILDTFTVMSPTEHYASPLANFTFDIQNALFEPVNADLYVSPTGDNNNSGLSADEPLQNILFALNKIIVDAENPHTIFLSDGVYSPSLTNELFPIANRNYCNIEGESRENTILDAEQTNRVIVANEVKLSVKNLTLTNGVTDNYGGGLWIDDSDIILDNLLITANTAQYYGGAIYSRDSNVSINKCSFHHNESHWAGAIYTSNSHFIISNSTFTSNLADYHGGAIYSYNSDVEVINTICWNNLPQELSIGSSTYGSSTLTVTNCDIMGGEANVEQYGQYATLNWLDNNIDIDPLFVDAENDNYLLQENSPCIDAGTAFFEWNDVILLDMGIEEYFGIAPDMGAFEYGMTSIEDEPELPMSNRKLTNYPNPFNPTTTISFSLTTNLHENVRIEIYNVKGQLVETLSNLPITNSPNQQIVWNANKFASGVYFYKLVVDDKAVDTKRMLLLK